MVAIIDTEKHAHASDEDARSSLPNAVPVQMELVPPDSEAEVKRVEKALVRRVDWCIIPLIMLLYLFSFLDRGTLFSPSPTCSTRWRCRQTWQEHRTDKTNS